LYRGKETFIGRANKVVREKRRIYTGTDSFRLDIEREEGNPILWEDGQDT
jgi:hypothetical protein